MEPAPSALSPSPKGSFISVVPTCALCHETIQKTLSCAYCLGSAYCSAECKKQDWHEHKFVCIKPLVSSMGMNQVYREALKGDPEAAEVLGLLFHHGVDPQLMQSGLIPALNVLADKENRYAVLTLGCIYDGIHQTGTALPYLIKAAKQGMVHGSTRACQRLGNRILQGTNLPPVLLTNLKRLFFETYLQRFQNCDALSEDLLGTTQDAFFEKLIKELMSEYLSTSDCIMLHKKLKAVLQKAIERLEREGIGMLDNGSKYHLHVDQDLALFFFSKATAKNARVDDQKIGA